MLATKKADPEKRIQGEIARLIPVGGPSQKEANATSAFLATLTAVDEFAQAITDLIGISLGKRSKLRCYTEVKFKVAKELATLRPDGLIQIDTSRKTLNYLVEAKIGKESMSRDQLEGYLRLARALDLDGVITISNQFSASPGAHPVGASGTLLRSTTLHHWSWAAIITEAVIVAKHKGVTDPDQAFILGELIRFLEHKNSGTIGFDSMGACWKEVSAKLFEGATLTPTGEDTVEAVLSWHQALRYSNLL